MAQSTKSRAQRRYITQVKCARQAKLSRLLSYAFEPESRGSEHRYAKQKSLNCGKTGCFMCSNPRRLLGNSKDALTIAERAALQREQRNFFNEEAQDSSSTD